MRYLVALGMMLALSGCGKSYRDLETAFGTEKVAGIKRLPADTIVITSQRNPGAESYHGITSVYVSASSVDIEVSVLFLRPISIPTQEIAACGMTCFGYDDKHVDLLIPKVGADVMIPASKELLDWCWETRRPMVPSSVRRNWAYNGVPLPPASNYAGQFESRAVFDLQTKQSCLGY